MTEETKPTTEVEPKPEAAPDAKPQGRADLSPEPADSEGNEPSQESPVTLEQVQAQLEAERAQREEAVRAMNESQRLAAEREREAEQYRGALGSLVNQQQLQADPMAAARQAYMEARENFDTQAELAALDRMNELNRQMAIRESIQTNRIATQVDQVTQQYGVDYDKLQQFHATMSPELIAKAMAIQNGTYEDIVARERAAKEDASRRAAAVGQLVGQGSPGTVPGGLAEQSEKRINDITFGLLPQSRQRELLENGFRVFNNRTGEDNTPAP